MPQQPGAMRNRWTAYAGVSTALAAGVIVKSLAQRPNFYSAAVYLSQSNANLMILCNLVFVTACSVILFLQRMLYGPLRPIEIEQLYEKAWFAVTETCLAMTIFRGEIGAWFLVMFFSLLAGKVWGWIGEGRVEVLEQQQHNILAGGNARLFHTRLAASLALSVVFDLTMLEYVVGQVLHMARPDMMVMFGFEFAVLSVTSLSTAMRYGLNLIEIGIVRKQKQIRIEAIRKERIDAAVRGVQEQQTATQSEATTSPSAENVDITQRITQATQTAAAQPIDEADVEVEGWEGKGRWIFYLDLATDFFKLVIYLSFFFILLIFYGLPLHIMRDVFLTCRSFFKRISDFMRYRTATRDMNERYPDATDAEIGREDVCIICREEMRPYVPPAQGQPRDPVVERMRPKKLPCGHVLHFSCLRSWLERQQICPTCRATVVPRPQGRSGTTAAAPAAAPAHPANRANPRPRVFQFGPLRIGVGAARGNNMLEELEQQLANINQPDAAGDGNLPQQYGFGFRWGGVRRRAHGHRHRGTVEDQLNAAERQLQREVDTLQASMGELQALRNVQAQLARIRMVRQGAPGQVPAPGSNVPSAPPTDSIPAITAVRPLSQDQSNPVLHAGSDQLPAGLTLPEGWSMMPLQPMNPHQMPAPPMIPQFGTVPVRFPQPGPDAAHHMAANLGADANMPLPVDIQALIQQSQEAARNATAQPEALINQQIPNGAQPQTTNQTTPQPQLSIQPPMPSSSPPENRAPPSSSANGTSRRPDTMPAISPPTLPTRTQPTQKSVPPQPGTAGSQNSRTATQHQSQSRSGTSSQTRITPQSVAQGRTSASTGAVQPPRLSPSTTTNGNRTTSTSPHRPTRSIGSSWGFSGVDKDDDDDDDDDDEDDNEEGKDSDSDEESDSGQQEVNSKANAEGHQPAKSKGKAPTVEDLVEDPD